MLQFGVIYLLCDSSWFLFYLSLEFHVPWQSALHFLLLPEPLIYCFTDVKTATFFTALVNNIIQSLTFKIQLPLHIHTNGVIRDTVPLKVFGMCFPLIFDTVGTLELESKYKWNNKLIVYVLELNLIFKIQPLLTSIIETH